MGDCVAPAPLRKTHNKTYCIYLTVLVTIVRQDCNTNTHTISAKKAKQRQQNNSSEQLQDAVFSFNPNLGLHSLDPASPFPVLAQKKIPINSQQ